MEKRVGDIVIGLDEKVDASEVYFHDPEEYDQLAERANVLRYDYFTLYNKDEEDYTNILNAVNEMNAQVDANKDLYYETVHSTVDLHLLDVASTSAVFAVRYKNSIVLSADSDEELDAAAKRFAKKYGVEGKSVDFTKQGSYKGIMYGQKQGKRMFQIGYAPRDISNAGLGLSNEQAKTLVEKRAAQLKRAREEENPIEDLSDVMRGSPNKQKKLPDLLKVLGGLLKPTPKPTPNPKPFVKKTAEIFDIAEEYGTKIVEPMDRKTVEKSFFTFRGRCWYWWVLNDWNDNWENVTFARGEGVKSVAYPNLYIDQSTGNSQNSIFRNKMTTPFLTTGIKKQDRTALRFPKSNNTIFNQFKDIDGSKFGIISIFQLVIIISASSSHANTVVIDRGRKLVIRFEPHGGFSHAYKFREVDRCFKDIVKGMMPGYDYMSPEDYQAAEGPQNKEMLNTNWLKIVDKAGRRREAGGFCGAFCMLFAKAYALAGAKYGPEAIADFMTNPTPNEIAEYIRHFMTWVVIKGKDVPDNKKW
jgi:hypothetical protein